MYWYGPRISHPGHQEHQKPQHPKAHPPLEGHKTLWIRATNPTPRFPRTLFFLAFDNNNGPWPRGFHSRFLLANGDRFRHGSAKQKVQWRRWARVRAELMRSLEKARGKEQQSTGGWSIEVWSLLVRYGHGHASLPSMHHIIRAHGDPRDGAGLIF